MLIGHGKIYVNKQIKLLVPDWPLHFQALFVPVIFICINISFQHLISLCILFVLRSGHGPMACGMQHVACGDWGSNLGWGSEI